MSSQLLVVPPAYAMNRLTGISAGFNDALPVLRNLDATLSDSLYVEIAFALEVAVDSWLSDFGGSGNVGGACAVIA